MQHFWPYIFGEPDIELVPELRKYYVWRNVLMHEIWQSVHLLFIFSNYCGDDQTDMKIHKGTSGLIKQ